MENTNEVLEIKINHGKAYYGATWKQYDLLIALNVEVPLNRTQFMKRVTVMEASQAISAAIAGRLVEFTC